MGLSVATLWQRVQNVKRPEKVKNVNLFLKSWFLRVKHLP
jgi:hypothetical protein